MVPGAQGDVTLYLWALGGRAICSLTAFLPRLWFHSCCVFSLFQTVAVGASLAARWTSAVFLALAALQGYDLQHWLRLHMVEAAASRGMRRLEALNAESTMTVALVRAASRGDSKVLGLAPPGAYSPFYGVKRTAL